MCGTIFGSSGLPKEIPEITLCTLQQKILPLKPIKSVFGTFCALLCFAVRKRRRREQPIQRTYDFNNNLVYCISQNQVLGQGININVLLYTFPSALHMLTKGLDWLKRNKNRWWCRGQRKSGGGGLWFKATPFIFTAGNELCLKLCFYFCWIDKRCKWETCESVINTISRGSLTDWR